MAIIGKALRRKWANDAYEAKHPELVQERIAYRAVCKQAHEETKARFAPFTADNFAEAAAFQERRIKELMS